MKQPFPLMSFVFYEFFFCFCSRCSRCSRCCRLNFASNISSNPFFSFASELIAILFFFSVFPPFVVINHIAISAHMQSVRLVTCLCAFRFIRCKNFLFSIFNNGANSRVHLPPASVVSVIARSTPAFDGAWTKRMQKKEWVIIIAIESGTTASIICHRIAFHKGFRVFFLHFFFYILSFILSGEWVDRSHPPQNIRIA